MSEVMNVGVMNVGQSKCVCITNLLFFLEQRSSDKGSHMTSYACVCSHSSSLSLKCCVVLVA